MRKPILEKIKTERTYFDGGTGTLLQEAGLPLGELPERWNVTHPDTVLSIHENYLKAGAQIIKSNTFGANPLKYGEDELTEVITAGMKLARTAADGYGGYVALDIGPLGKLLKPYGDLDFEEAVEAFKTVVRTGKDFADLILVETMNDSYETKAAVLAAKEESDLPLFVTNVYGEDGKLMTGATPEAMIALLEGLGVDALGMNCSLGARQMLPIIPAFVKYASVSVIINPNAGLPKEENGKLTYDVDAEEFSSLMKQIALAGVNILGGCCGTTPEYIEKTVNKTKDLPFSPVSDKKFTLISSYTHAVEFTGGKTVRIGERINPTGKKRFKQALKEHDIGYILKEGIGEQECGADVLDVNVGLPEIDEPAMLLEVTKQLQSVCDLPLQIDTADPNALAHALRHYNGKAMINSVNGKKECMDAVFPLAKKYGGLTVALTLDENGIPDTAQERLGIAVKIENEAKKYGIDRKDLIFDPLALAVSSKEDAGKVTLEAVRLLHENGYRTSLGVSNVSFGLPARDAVNGAFFTLAMENGLNAAIMNVYSAEMNKAFFTFNLLCGRDPGCRDYIEYAAKNEASLVLSADTPKQKSVETQTAVSGIADAVVKGLKESAGALTEDELKTKDPLEIINGEIIPALDTVGREFEEKTLFLPQLLMSAEAAKAAFEKIKVYYADSGKSREKRSKFVIATVYGDIHDIGKNIVKVILENYGFDVIDLGKDVPPESVVDAVVKAHAPLVGLSALMTTTVASMAQTVKLLREAAPWCKIVVGGAVMTQEYADKIGADKYARDAMEAVRYAEKTERETGKI